MGNLPERSLWFCPSSADRADPAWRTRRSPCLAPGRSRHTKSPDVPAGRSPDAGTTHRPRPPRGNQSPPKQRTRAAGNGPHHASLRAAQVACVQRILARHRGLAQVDQQGLIQFHRSRPHVFIQRSCPRQPTGTGNQERTERYHRRPVVRPRSATTATEQSTACRIDPVDAAPLGNHRSVAGRRRTAAVVPDSAADSD